MGNCRECRWWDSIEEDDPGMGFCTMLGTLKEQLPLQLHLAHGRGRVIIVGELFGCVQFEPKVSLSRAI